MKHRHTHTHTQWYTLPFPLVDKHVWASCEKKVESQRTGEGMWHRMMTAIEKGEDLFSWDPHIQILWLDLGEVFKYLKTQCRCVKFTWMTVKTQCRRRVSKKMLFTLHIVSLHLTKNSTLTAVRNLTQCWWVLQALSHSFTHTWTHCSEDSMVWILTGERGGIWHQRKVKQGVLAHPVFIFLLLFPQVELSPPERFHLSIIPPPHTTDPISSASPVSVLVGYKNQNSRHFLPPLLRPYSFALKNMCVFFFFLILILIFFFPCESRIRLRLQLHVLGVHYVQVFGLNDMRKHVVPKHRTERIDGSCHWRHWEGEKKEIKQCVTSYRVRFITSCSAVSANKREESATHLWLIYVTSRHKLLQNTLFQKLSYICFFHALKLLIPSHPPSITSSGFRCHKTPVTTVTVKCQL